MKLNKTKTRLLLCGVILLTFFIPAYNGTSGAGFISNAFAEANTHPEITRVDVLIAITPLLLVLASAVAIFIRSYFMQRSVRLIYLALPLLFTTIFLSILFFFAADGTYAFTSPKVLLEMQIGFYIHVLACCLLVFTKKYKRKKRQITSQPAEAVAV